MAQRKEFMFLFRYEPSDNHQPSASEMEESQLQWGAFIGNLAIQEKLVSTHQLGFEGAQIFADKSVGTTIHVANKQTLGGNMVVNANTLDEAVGMAKNCPILLMGGTVEVRAIQPM